MTEVHESWSMGYLIGWPVWIIVLLFLLVCAGGLLFSGMDEGEGVLIGTGIAAVIVWIGLVVLFFSPFGQYPTGGDDYHKWKPKQGEVTQVAKRLVAAGDKSMEEKVVVVFKGSTQEYGVTDTRASLVEKGDVVVLKCKKSYEWGGVPGYDCKFIARTPKAEVGK